jgi:ABC-2 type transport system ATP-binding protein
MSPPPTIIVDRIEKSFGAVRALDGLSFELPRGATCAILGHNGAGKTTTIRALLGLVAVDGGDVRVLGRDPIRDGREVRARVGVLLERDGLYERLSALGNLEYHARIHGLDRAARASRIEDVLRLFGLWERRRERVGTWSTGMRKKLAIARALLHKPELLLLDEPFAGLDPVAAAELRTLIVRLASRDGLTVVMTTHDLAHVERSCSHVIVADHGRAIAQGTLEELQGRAGSTTVQIGGRGLDEAVLGALQTDGLIERWERAADGWRVVCPPAARPRLGVELVKRGVELEELHTVTSSLEDVFLSLVQPGGEA